GKQLVTYNCSSPVTFTSASSDAQKLSVILDKGTNNINGVKVYLWDNVDNARPLLNFGNVENTGDSVEAILIGGKVVEINNSTNTGSVEVNAGYMEWPDIVVLTDNITTPVKVDVKGVFPLSKPAHCIIGSNESVVGESKEAFATITVGDDKYNITVTQAIPQITDVKFRQYVAGKETEVIYYEASKLKIQYDLQNPVWTDAIPGPHKEKIGDYLNKYHMDAKNLENISFAYSDTYVAQQNTMFYYDIAPVMLGSQCFLFPFSDKTSDDKIDDYYTFTIDRSARIFVRDSKGVLDSTWKQAKNSFNSSANMFYELRASATGSSVQYGTGNATYYKDFNVKPGETCTISLPSPSGKISPKIFVKYMDNEFVTNASYTIGGTKTSIGTTYFGKPFFVDPDATTNKYKFFKHGNDTANSNIYNNGNLIYSTATFLADSKGNWNQNCLVVVPDELEGATALVTPFKMDNIEKVEFDVNTSVRIYMFVQNTANNDNIKTRMGEGWTNTSFTYDDASLNSNDITIAFRGSDSATSSSTLFKNQSSFYKDFIVQPDDTEHITLNLPTNYIGGLKIVFVIKPLEE
ncbi:MAG: hypothetical protein UH854_01670, partial [Clostridia bacterium]|nr:hypothetical protein [Clostridia bacterium]